MARPLLSPEELEVRVQEIQDRIVAPYRALPWYVLTDLPDGARRLTLLPDAKGRGQEVYERRPDGRMKHFRRWEDEERRATALPARLLPEAWGDLSADRRSHAAVHQFLKELLKDQGANRFLGLLPQVQSPRYCHHKSKDNHLTLWCRQLEMRLRQPRRHASHFGELIPIPPTRRFETVFQPLLRQRLLDPEVLQQAQEWFHPHRTPGRYRQPDDRVTAAQYNFALRHGARLQPLAGSPTAAWIDRCPRAKKALQRGASPARLQQLVAADLELTTPARRKAFAQLPLTPDSLRESNKEDLLLYLELAVAANSGDPRCDRDGEIQSRAYALLYCSPRGHEIRRCSEARQDPEIWAGWVHICRRFMQGIDLEIAPYTGRWAVDLAAAADAYLAAAQAGERWPRSPSWRHYFLRSQRWHRGILVRHNELIAAETAALTWLTPLEGQTQPKTGRCSKPLGTPRLLSEYGQAMRNCLSSYITRCAAGDTLIYAFHDKDDTIAAAAEFYRREKESLWRLGNLEGPRHSAAPAWVRPWARRIAEELNALEEEKEKEKCAVPNPAATPAAPAADASAAALATEPAAA